jgi:hypothetical protein
MIKAALAISLATLVCTVGAGSASAGTGSPMVLTCLKPGQITLWGIPRTATRVRFSFKSVVVRAVQRPPHSYIASVRLVDRSTEWFPRSRFRYGKLSIHPRPGHANRVAATVDARFGHGRFSWTITQFHALTANAAATVRMKSGRLLHVSATGCGDGPISITS